MATITMRYEGELHCEAVHTSSGSALNTDAPKDNHGRGGSFSPTDLVATALGTCILTTMAIVAESMKLDIHGAHATVEKAMATQLPRRIASLKTNVVMPTGIAIDHRERLEAAAHKCPVHHSLHPDIDAPITFTWA